MLKIFLKIFPSLDWSCKSDRQNSWESKGWPNYGSKSIGEDNNVSLTLSSLGCSDSEQNHAANNGKMEKRCKNDSH